MREGLFKDRSLTLSKVQATVVEGSRVEIPATLRAVVADIFYGLRYTSEYNLRAL